MKKTITLLLILALLTLTFSGCSSTPPSVAEFQTLLTAEYETLEIIVSFLLDCGYRDAYIDDTSDRLFSDHSLFTYWCRGDSVGYDRREIEDVTVKTAVENFCEKTDCEYISKDDDTIVIDLWSYSSDLWGGIAYCADHKSLPDVDYVTQMMPLLQEGWHYYICDFNEWRIESTRGA